MRATVAVLLCALLVTPACDRAPATAREAASTLAGPPNSKEILRHLFRNLDVSLGVDQSCNGVGSSDDDRTIGDYLSGFFAEHANETGQNWLDVKATATTTADGKAAWQCVVMVRRRDAEDEMGWGTQFLLTADNRVQRDSFRCLGGG